MAKEQPDMNDPEVNSDFARQKRRAEEKGTAEGYDPDTGERAAVTFRQLFNETGGDAAAAEKIFRDVARAGGYGDVAMDQALDIRSLQRSVEENKTAVEKGVDFKGRALDLYGKHQMKQQAQHQDNLVNAVGEVLERLKKG
jgi:hypothetical protein